MRRLFFFPCIALLVCACAKSPTVPRAEEVLGTLCTVNAFSDGSAALYDELFARLHQIDDTFSVNKAGTELDAVNEAAGERAVFVSDEVISVLKTALSVSEMTYGAFNPAIGALVSLWGINTENARVPSAQERAAVLPYTDWRSVVLDGAARTVYLTKKGTALDLGGIAKGYAADQLALLLRAHKVRRAIIDLGGNIYLHGAKADGSDWRVGIKDPENPLASAALVLTLPAGKDNAVVTSGVYERFFEADGVRYHHILDAQTGFPAQSGLLSVTVVSPSSLLADALTTGMFVLGAEKALALAKRLGVSAVFISEAHEVTAYCTDGVSVSVLSDGYRLTELQ